MNSSVTVEDVNTINNLENRYRHNSFMYGLNTIDEGIEKCRLIIELYSIFQQKSENETDFAQNKQFVTDLAKNGLLSPEAAAWILVFKCPGYDNATSVVDRIYRDLSLNDYLMFAYYCYGQVDKIWRESYQISKCESFSIKHIEDRLRTRYGKNKSNQFSGKCAVYSVITGSYDCLHDPAYINDEWDYYLYTDKPDNYKSDVWKIRQIPVENLNNSIMMARYVKTHPHILLLDYDYTIYMDGKFVITSDMSDYIGIYSKSSSMICFPHPCNKTIKEEANLVANTGSYDLEPMIKQINEYYDNGYNDQLPLVDSGVLIRSNHDEKLNKVMEDWWDEIKTKTTRDQLSLGYSCWKNEYRFDISDRNIYNNSFFVHVGHEGFR